MNPLYYKGGKSSGTNDNRFVSGNRDGYPNAMIQILSIDSDIQMNTKKV